MGEGSGWDLRIRPAAVPAASGNLGMFHGKMFMANVSQQNVHANVDQETLGHLSQSTGWYLASWSCLCSAVLGHSGGRRVQVFRLPEGIHDGFLDSQWVLGFTMGSWVHDKVHVKSLDFFVPCAKAAKASKKEAESLKNSRIEHPLCRKCWQGQ